MKKTEKISTGSYDFNKWLFGGYERDIITMIAGPPGSGKTNFCILAACSQAKKGKKVIFVDTEGGFSIDRVRQIVGEESDVVLNNILILGSTSFKEQEKHFVEILGKIKKEHVGLIVIDGMVTLYRIELGEARGKDEEIRELNGKLASQMRMLSVISRKQNIPVLITNQVYADFQSEEEWRNHAEKKVNLLGHQRRSHNILLLIKILFSSQERLMLLAGMQ